MIPAKVINLQERKLKMVKKEIFFPDPFKQMGYESEDILGAGGFGALTARAGVGKTAFLVQIALSRLIKNNNILHVSLNNPVEKVCLQYEEVFRNLAEKYKVKVSDQFWETILPNRFIMTFKVESFSAPKLEERVNDLIEQGIFFPRMIVIDGLPFDEAPRKTFADLKSLAQKHNLPIWFTVRTHRHAPPGPDGIPLPMLHVADLFEAIFELQSEEKEIRIQTIRTKIAC